MAINDEIAAGGRPVQFENPLNNMVKFSNIQNDMANMALHKQKMAEDARLQGLNVQFGLDLANLGDPASPEYENKLRQAFINKGDPKGYQEHKTAVLANKNTEADIQKKRQDTAGQAYRNIVYNPSPENIIAHNQDFQLDPNNSPQDKAKSQRTADMLAAMPLDQRVAWLSSQNASAADLKPSQHTVASGDRTVVLTTPAYGGPSTEVGSVQMGATPKEKLEYTPKYLAEVAARDKTADDIKKTVALYDNSSGTPMREVFKSQLQDYYTRLDEQDKRIAGMKSEEAELKRPRQEFENLLRDRAARVAKLGAAAKNDPEVKGMTARINYLTTHPGQEPVDPRKVANTVPGESGSIDQFNIYGQKIGHYEGVAKPSAQFIKTREQTKTLGKNLDLAIAELENATKDGGLIDQSTGSGLGKLANTARGFITGGASKGAIAGAKLAPIADLGLKMVPRFEGPQSDKDTQSYKEASGQLADTSIPNEIRKDAGKTVLRLLKARKGQFVTPEMAAQGEAPAGGGNPAPPAGFVLN